MLLNQDKNGGGAEPPADPNAKFLVCGYDAKTGEAVYFELPLEGKLPAGFVDSPAKVRSAK